MFQPQSKYDDFIRKLKQSLPGKLADFSYNFHCISQREHSCHLAQTILQVPPEHGNVLEVSCKLPGYLATGVSSDLVVTFTPKANDDIDTAIEMLADTGPFFIPIRCQTKKAVMSVASTQIDFGPGVILAESASRALTISNEGALDVEYSFSVENKVGQR